MFGKQVFSERRRAVRQLARLPIVFCYLERGFSEQASMTVLIGTLRILEIPRQLIPLARKPKASKGQALFCTGGDTIKFRIVALSIKGSGWRIRRPADRSGVERSALSTFRAHF